VAACDGFVRQSLFWGISNSSYLPSQCRGTYLARTEACGSSFSLRRTRSLHVTMNMPSAFSILVTSANVEVRSEPPDIIVLFAALRWPAALEHRARV
jgi:hypothetical protein